MINVFLSQASSKTHGRMLNIEKAKKCGLKIEKIDLRSDIWNCLWELYVRSDWLVSNRAAKLIETTKTTLVT